MDQKKHDTALVLQGGGALGAYQAGAIGRLSQEGIFPRHVAGISIGAINAALFAGNPPARRAERLEAFWQKITSATAWPGMSSFGAGIALTMGAPGFFRPRLLPTMAVADASQASFYDTGPLRSTLENLVDFDLLNDGSVRFVIGAVDVATGNFVWFDNAEQRIRPEHVMASGALPPGFAPVEIEGRFYWDGGLVSNTPLERVVRTRLANRPLVVWQVDLFPAAGAVPRSIWQVEAREKDIRYSSRTRAVTDWMVHEHDLAVALHSHKDRLPEDFRLHPAIEPLLKAPPPAPLTLIHLIYRSNPRESGTKDFDFSHDVMMLHWSAGAMDVERTLSHPRLWGHDVDRPGTHVFDLANVTE
ncbi:MAG: patatin-like phospholipase family protein [Hyphomonadaceae bacterium]|nr:patatin-like phospholipase family protein [Hyphomonadaceae bacterium]